MSFKTYLVEDVDNCATVVPERGGIITGLTVDGVELFYLDRTTLEDATKNVRGGVPVLFPFAGKLEGGKFVAAGTEMKQHGFGRNKVWKVTATRTGVLRMTLEDDVDTRALYPYSFSAEQSISILPSGMQVDLQVINTGKTELPVSPGWHPYFNCPATKKSQVKGEVVGLDTSRFTDAQEFDFGIEPPLNGRVKFELPGLGVLRLSFSPEMRHLQFWSQPGKDFICIEPFWGPNDTINTQRRDIVAPGRARHYWMRIELT